MYLAVGGRKDSIALNIKEDKELLAHIMGVIAHISLKFWV